MVIGERLKALREKKNMSQGEMEKRSGLVRSYISRVENGHTVPAIETLEKMAYAVGVPLYQIFYGGRKLPVPLLPKMDDCGWGSSGRDAKTFGRFRRLLERTPEPDRKLLLYVAQKMSQKNTCFVQRKRRRSKE